MMDIMLGVSTSLERSKAKKNSFGRECEEMETKPFRRLVRRLASSGNYYLK